MSSSGNGSRQRFSGDDEERQDIENQHLALVPGGGGVAHMKENYQHDLRLLIGITGLVLLIACANLANLQLARGAANAGADLDPGRARRSALPPDPAGAGRKHDPRGDRRRRSACSSPSETAGLLLRLALQRRQLRPHRHHAVPARARLYVPALGRHGRRLRDRPGMVRVARRSRRRAARRRTRRSGRSTLPQKSLVVLQAALSLVLLAGAGLMVQTLRNLTSQQFGFHMEGAMVVNVNAGFGGYAPEKLAAIYGEIDRQTAPDSRRPQRRARPLQPDVRRQLADPDATLEDRPEPAALSPSWDRVSPSFFDTIGARILRGRGFNDRDTPDATHVAVVNQAFADHLLPEPGPDRQALRPGRPSAPRRLPDRRRGQHHPLPQSARPGRPMFFLPLLQMCEGGMGRTTARRGRT